MADKYDFNKTENIRVICRFRPASKTEKEEEKAQGLSPDEPKFVRNQKEVVMKYPPPNQEKKKFNCVLDRMFRMHTPQKKIFDEVGRPMVQAVLEGFNATIFAYGQTGSGKTYTMFGPDQKKAKSDDIGLVQRCCSYLFDKLRKLESGPSADVLEWQVTASFIQIYKEHLSDLLEPRTKNLQIRTDFQTDTPYVDNLRTVSVNGLGDVLKYLMNAFSNRIVASHKLNSESSRSHMLLTLNVEQKIKDGSVKKSKMNFGDLAGSEDISKALGPNPDPERMKEAIAINSTLTALTTAISYLSKGQRPSYRSSSLTHILQDSLGGNSKTTMIVAASPHQMNRTETVRTLRFAMTAKTVKNKAKINKQLTRKQLMRRIEELEAMNAKLGARVIELEMQMKEEGLEVELTEELYGNNAGLDNQYSSGEDESDGDFDEDPDYDSIGTKKKRKKSNTKSPKSPTRSPAKVKFSADVVDNVPNMTEPRFLKKQASRILSHQVSSAHLRVQAAQHRNEELEQEKIHLLSEIDAVSKKWAESREIIESMNKSAKKFERERRMLQDRIEEMEKELIELQSQKQNQTIDLEKRNQRLQRNITMKNESNKELQKQVKELNLQNEELLKQYDLMTKQMRSVTALNMKNNKNGQNQNGSNDQEVAELLKELDNVELNAQEQEMEPADLLLHRFAAMEANDFRLTPEQRMKKTAKMMTDISDDIGGLMEKWLPKNKVRSDRHRDKTLVFQVRQLIGHFNVLVGQMKEAERGKEGAAERLKQKDRKIKELEEANLAVFKLKNEVKSKEMTISQLERDRDYYKMRVEDEENMEQTEMEVQDQVRYLTNLMRQRKSTNINDMAGREELSLLAMMSNNDSNSVPVGVAALLSPDSAVDRDVHALTPMHIGASSESLDEMDGDGNGGSSSFGFPKPLPPQGRSTKRKKRSHTIEVSAEIEWYDDDDQKSESVLNENEIMLNGNAKHRSGGSSTGSHSKSVHAQSPSAGSLESSHSEKKKRKRKKSANLEVGRSSSRKKKDKHHEKKRSRTVASRMESSASKKGRHSKTMSGIDGKLKSKSKKNRNASPRPQKSGNQKSLSTPTRQEKRRKTSTGSIGLKSKRSSTRSSKH